MNYNVINSSSSGNAVLIDSLLIDCGLSYTALNEYNFESVYITHRHSDHVKISTLKKLIKDGKKIYTPQANKKFLSEKLEADLCNKIKFINPRAGLTIENLFDTYHIVFTKVEHDVANYALNILLNDDTHIFYCTDMKTLSNCHADNYEYYFVECNYDVNKLHMLQESTKIVTNNGYEFSRFNRSEQSHCSKQEAIKWVNSQKGNKFKKFIKLHKSSVAYK